MRLVILFTLSLFLSPSLWAAKDAAPKPADAFLFSGAYFTQNFNNDAATAGILALHSDGTLTNSLAGMFCSPGTDGCGLTAPDQGSLKMRCQSFSSSSELLRRGNSRMNQVQLSTSSPGFKRLTPCKTGFFNIS
jgi:hypothetical protein